MESGIDDYVGEWGDECGRHLRIAKLGNKTALVSLVVNDQAVARPWYENKLSTDMIGTYDPVGGPELVEQLWEERKGFTLHLCFEPKYGLDRNNRDALTVGLTRFEQDGFLDKYYSLFGPLKHYVRTTE